MKTYLLRQSKTVESQKIRRPSRPQPVAAANAPEVLRPADGAPHGPVLHIGLDVHTASIAVSIAPSATTEVRRYGMIGGTHDDVLRLAKKLQAAHPGVTLRFCYEAGPGGYVLYRQLHDLKQDCQVVAPSLIPKKPGERVKTDRRDSLSLARLHRAGELTAVWIPGEAQEALRDLTRAREDMKHLQRQAKQRLLSFLSRHGHRYSGKCRWTQAHWRWLEGLKFAQPVQQIVLQEYRK